MMPALSALELVREIVRPALAVLPDEMQGDRPEQQLVGTAAQETQFRNIPQIGGPALGLWQMEPATHLDLWTHFIDPRPDLARAVMSLLDDGFSPTASALIPCPKYACAMARILYFRVPGAIPADLAGQGAYYKAHYNTPAGAATVSEYLDHWNSLVAPYAHQLWLNPPT
jgi:hypothetical protein